MAAANSSSVSSLARWSRHSGDHRQLRVGRVLGCRHHRTGKAGVAATFDDLYRLGRQRRLALEADGVAIELHSAENYPFAQVWVPRGRPVAALERMGAPTNALVAGMTPFVPSGEAFTATFALTIT